jgi:hypothetical protein
MNQTRILQWSLIVLLVGIVIGIGESCGRPVPTRIKEIGPPTKTIPLDPSDRSTGVPLNQIMTWMAAKRATSYDIYFGKENPPAFRANTTSTSCNPGALDYLTTYYWRIDAKNDRGTTQGNVRIFTTVGR